MPEPPVKLPNSAEKMIREVAAKQDRMVRARKRKNGIWGSISILGVVGWSVCVPTLVGVAVGVWIDRHWPSRFSWALMLLIGGLILGCVNAWFRIKEDQR
ncbi:MAG: AtpZ/AtpI family protein [Bryobacteraceae bacterium]|jgi:ATP synthase protein I